MASDQELANAANPRALEPDDDPGDLYDLPWDDADDDEADDDAVEMCGWCGEELACCRCGSDAASYDDWED